MITRLLGFYWVWVIPWCCKLLVVFFMFSLPNGLCGIRIYFFLGIQSKIDVHKPIVSALNADIHCLHNIDTSVEKQTCTMFAYKDIQRLSTCDTKVNQEKQHETIFAFAFVFAEEMHGKPSIDELINKCPADLKFLREESYVWGEKKC